MSVKHWKANIMKFVQLNSESASVVSVSDSVVAKILSFARLEKGWHYGNGQPSTKNIVGTALRLRAKLNILGADTIEAFPRLDGSIVVSAINGTTVVDVTCRTDGNFDLYIEMNDKVTLDVEEVVYSEIVARIRFLEWRGSSRYAYFTPCISPTSEGDSIAPPFSRPTMVSPSLTAFVPSVVAEPNVSTSPTTTHREFPALRLYSSGSISRAYQNMSSDKIRLKPGTHVTS